MTPELDLPSSHPPRRPYATHSHIHRGPLVIDTHPSLCLNPPWCLVQWIHFTPTREVYAQSLTASLDGSNQFSIELFSPPQMLDEQAIVLSSSREIISDGLTVFPSWNCQGTLDDRVLEIQKKNRCQSVPHGIMDTTVVEGLSVL